MRINKNHIRRTAGVLVYALFLLVLAACGGEQGDKNGVEDPLVDAEKEDMALSEAEQGSGNVVAEKDGIKLIELKTTDKFADAGLTLDEAGSTMNEMYIKTFRFKTAHFDLSDPMNSIVLIHNNRTSQLSTRPAIKQALMTSGNNVVLAYLYNALEGSIKHKGAYVLLNEVFEGKDELDKSASHLFYNLPKGYYEYADVVRVPLDFYLFNTELSEGGNKVQLTIDDKVTFDITKWASYGIEGLGKGEHTVRLVLTDNEGVNIFGPFTDSGTRKFFIVPTEELEQAIQKEHEEKGHLGNPPA